MKRFATIVLSVIMIISLCSCGKKTTTVTASELTNYTLSGVNGHGKVSLSKDRTIKDRIISDLYGDGVTDAEKMKVELLLEVGFECKVLGETENLSNGDDVVISVEYNKADFDDIGIKVSETKYGFKVFGLSEAIEIDVFDGFDLSYRGLSTQASPISDTSKCNEFVKSNVTFTMNLSYNVSNGDVILVTASCPQTKLDEKNYLIKETTKEITVQGLYEYITDPSKYALNVFDTEMSEKATSSLSTSSYKLGDTVTSYKLMSNGGLSENWKIDSLETTPVKKIFAYTIPENYDTYSNNKYVTFYKLNVTATKTSSNNFVSNPDGYNVGETNTFEIFLRVDISSIIGDGNGGNILMDKYYIDSYIYGNSMWGEYIGMSLDDVVTTYTSTLENYTIIALT